MSEIFVRELNKGMGQAVAERTILRRKENGRFESWGDVAERVALGNSLLCPNPKDGHAEYTVLHKHIAQASILLSGRHLQHGDENQPSRNMEVFTNCSTAAASFLLFYLLLNGSGVGRSYDDDIMLVDWDNAPNLRIVLDSSHPDFDWSAHESVRDALHKYGHDSKNVMWFKVADSREGWASALEVWENAAFEKIHKDKTLILDFSAVRTKGSPIGGMQDRPASGPVPLMNAFLKAASLKGSGLPMWKQAMYLDHYFAECVLVGGTRRAARMSTKMWSDPDIVEFIQIKRPIEFDKLTMEEVIERRKTSTDFSFLWSSNNSVMVDAEFWRLLELKRSDDEYKTDRAKLARKVYKEISQCSYADGTGEPGIINVDKLVRKDDGLADLAKNGFVGSKKYQVRDDTELFLSRLAKKAKKKQYNQIVNPCVTVDTWVMTDVGPRMVSDLIDRPFRAMVNGTGYNSAGFWKTGTKAVYELVTNRGYRVKATADHKILTTDGWVEVKDLIVDQHEVVLNNNRSNDVDHDQTEFDHGWLIGSIVGDGCYNPEKYRAVVRFWGSTANTMAEMAYSVVSEMEQDYFSPIKASGYTHHKGKDISEIASRKLDQLCDGFISPLEKNILPTLEAAPDSIVRGFLRGFFDADGSPQGSLNKGFSIRLAQSSKEKLVVVQRMLSRFGILSSLHLRSDRGTSLLPDGKGGKKEYQVKPMYELIIGRDSVETFNQTIGFYEPLKQTRVDETIAFKKKASYRDKFCSLVKSVTYVGEEDVYDCTVDVVHMFDANGILVHNCGEIALSVLGGYCVIADVVPFHADTLDEAEEAFRVATRALIRTNTMDSLYHKETSRTNRIGVGMTGIHEFAWKFFQVGFKDLINPDFIAYQDNADPLFKEPRTRAAAFWKTLSRFNAAVIDEAKQYSAKLGLNVPHTMTTIKPAGTTSKLFGLTEGWHLPSMAFYLRWVQFRTDDPLVKTYADAGYPTRALKTYEGTTIVGFPTAPVISTLGMGNQLVTAAEATPEEQYQWLKLGEKYWIIGETGEDFGNQISYTLKYDPKQTDFKHFSEMLRHHQKEIRACSVMPQSEDTSYEYLPEEQITKIKFEELSRMISQEVQEDVAFEHIDCSTGACPIDFKSENAAVA